MVLRLHGAREDDNVHPTECFFPQSFDGNFVGSPTHDPSIELRPDGSEIKLGVVADPVEFSVRARDETVETHGHDIANSPHGGLQDPEVLNCTELSQMLQFLA